MCVRWDCPRPSGEPGHILQPLFKLDPHSLIELLCPAEAGIEGGYIVPHLTFSGKEKSFTPSIFLLEKSNAASRSNNPSS